MADNGEGSSVSITSIPFTFWFQKLTRHRRLDGKGTFRPGLFKIRERLEERFYTSVSTFSTDLGTVFTSAIGMATAADTAEVQFQIIGDRSRKDLSAEQKEKRKYAKRIIKAIQPALEDAMRKESELCRRPFEKELRDLDLLLETSLSSRRDSMTGSVVEDVSDDEAEVKKPTVNGTTPAPGEDHPMTNGDIPHSIETAQEPILNGIPYQDSASDQPSSVPEPITNHPVAAIPPPRRPSHPPSETSTIPKHPPSSAPNFSTTSTTNPTALSQGGIPWYMEPFDPHGTTIYEERWTGREVARGMSEELSDMDEEELDGLVEGSVVEEGVVRSVGGSVVGAGEGEREGEGKRVERRKNGRVKKRWRGFK